MTDILVSCQTILPLLHCFGKGLSDDGIDVLVRIGNDKFSSVDLCSDLQIMLLICNLTRCFLSFR